MTERKSKEEEVRVAGAVVVYGLLLAIVWTLSAGIIAQWWLR